MYSRSRWPRAMSRDRTRCASRWRCCPRAVDLARRDPRLLVAEHVAVRAAGTPDEARALGRGPRLISPRSREELGSRQATHAEAPSVRRVVATAQGGRTASASAACPELQHADATPSSPIRSCEEDGHPWWRARPCDEGHGHHATSSAGRRHEVQAALHPWFPPYSATRSGKRDDSNSATARSEAGEHVLHAWMSTAHRRSRQHRGRAGIHCAARR